MEVRVLGQDIFYPQILMDYGWRYFTKRGEKLSFPTRKKAWDWLFLRFPDSPTFQSAPPQDPEFAAFEKFKRRLEVFLDEAAGSQVAPDEGLVISYTPLQTGTPEWAKLWIQSSEVVPTKGGGTDLLEQGWDWSSPPPESCGPRKKDGT